MTTAKQNPNLRRRVLPGVFAQALTPLLKPFLNQLKIGKTGETVDGSSGTWTVFASYMVGDFFMALPALKFLKKSADAAGARLVVVCRPDCLEFLAREGISGIPFADAFRVRPGLGSFVSTWRAAWSLRQTHGGPFAGEVLDLDADPRTAFWLKVAGAGATASYGRASSSLFDHTFDLPEPSIHQADRDLRVAEEWVRRLAGGDLHGSWAELAGIAPAPGPNQPWILSVWTRKAAKNWPLARWDALIETLLAEKVPLMILDAPDGDAAFRAFRMRWSGRAEFFRGTLTEVSDKVQECAGVIATDNFLGHMAGYYGKPVLWINRVSPAHQVEPRGPRTIAVTNPDVEAVRSAFDRLRAPLTD